MTKIENNVEVETFISKMSVQLLSFDMTVIFTSFPVLDEPDQEESEQFRNGNTVNLIQAWDTIGPVKESLSGTLLTRLFG